MPHRKRYHSDDSIQVKYYDAPANFADKAAFSPGDQFKAWDTSGTFDYMPSQFVTFRFEYDHRASNFPYFAGAGGVTPPGGNTGAPGSFVPGFFPDLRKRENRFNLALLVKL